MTRKFSDIGSNVQEKDSVDRSRGAARAIPSLIDPGLSWKIHWFLSITKLLIIPEGIQRVEDVLKVA